MESHRLRNQLRRLEATKPPKCFVFLFLGTRGWMVGEGNIFFVLGLKRQKLYDDMWLLGPLK